MPPFLFFMMISYILILPPFRAPVSPRPSPADFTPSVYHKDVPAYSQAGENAPQEGGGEGAVVPRGDAVSVEHEVWFEDVRSLQGKFDLIREFDLGGCGYWQIMRWFAANWRLLYKNFYTEK